jgi:tagatose 1,6-diphosphate aldolase
MKTITPGKFLNLQRCATANGGFSILALDHRNNLRKALKPEAPEQVSGKDMSDFKLEVTGALSRHASAMLLDPEVGAFQVIARRALERSCGLIAALDATGYGGEATARESRILPGWSVQKAKLMGANAVKLLVYYHPKSRMAPEVEALVAQVNEECARYDLPFILEPLVYSIDPEVKKLTGNERSEAILETAARLTAFGCDLLKVEFPADAHETPELPIWQRACAELTKASRAPWVLLSAAVDYDSYLKQVETACRQGASGIAAGRAVWSEAVTGDRRARAQFLSTSARARMEQLTSTVDHLAVPYWQYYQTAEVDEETYLSYFNGLD